jgi:orotate phosphoribosyltransferase-like protein
MTKATEAINLKNSGKSDNRIASELNITRHQLRLILAGAGLQEPPKSRKKDKAEDIGGFFNVEAKSNWLI